MSTDETSAKTASRVVVLLHGFAAHWTLMTRLQKHFERAGHRTVNWGYNSWFRSIDYHANRLRQHIAELDSDHAIETIDFVTHSMGCIVTRAALSHGLPGKAGRWVMLAPPNRGSYIANSVPRFIKRVMKPVEELQAKDESYVNQLPIPEGIDIAVLQAEADFIVADELTRIPADHARQVFPGLHSQLLFRQDVREQTLHFLYHGKLPETDLSDNDSRDESR